MPELRINLELVEELAGKIKTEHDGTVTELIARLRGYNDQLDGAWDGPSQTQFQTTYGNWVGELEKFADTLTSVNQYLVSVAQQFRELDEAARKAAMNTGGGA